jgi:uncharacterized membrane protein
MMAIALEKENEMNNLMLVLRLIHVLGGVFWAGGALVMTFFIIPSIGATAEAGQKVMGHLLTQTKVSLTMTIASISSVAAGAILYWIDSDGLTNGWMTAGPGIGFAIGGFFGLVALGAGLMVPRVGKAMGMLAAQIKGVPSPEQQAQLAILRKRQATVSMINAAGLFITIVFMGISRYLRF